MALNLYRRHRKECEGSHSEDTRTGQFEEGRRGWKKCACAIHVSGTLGGKFSRRQTGTADWDEAKALVALWQQSGSWDGQDKIEAPLPLPATNPEPERISVDRAIAAFTAEFEEHTALNTQRNYKFVLKQLRGFSDAKGYAAIDQCTPIDVREFRSTWGVLPSTAAKNMSVVKAFFEFCHANEWTSRNPARMVRNQRGQHNDPRSEQKLPFSDAELRRMYAACDTKYGKREIQFSRATKARREQGPYAQFKTRWTGAGHCRFYFGVGLYGLEDFGREHVSCGPHEGRRHHSAQDHEGAHPRLHMGSRMAAGTHSRARPGDRPVHFRGSTAQRI